jgi:BlaI family penicillinase repressor
MMSNKLVSPREKPFEKRNSVMARPSSRHPTELELQILKILWRDGPSPVRHVRDALSQFRNLAYTSVMTIMNIMTKKGYLKRRKHRGRYAYSPKVSERSVSGGILSDLMDRVFDGSAVALMLNLLETSDVDERELKELREIIRSKIREGAK